MVETTEITLLLVLHTLPVYLVVVTVLHRSMGQTVQHDKAILRGVQSGLDISMYVGDGKKKNEIICSRSKPEDGLFSFIFKAS